MNPMVYFVLALTAVLAATSNAAVQDINGDIIFGGSYYVLPVVRGRGGGVSLSDRGREHCSLYVVQESSEVDQGVPVKFSNWRPKVAFVPESQNLNIESQVGIDICMRPTYWWVDEFDQLRKKWFLKAGPKPEVPGEDSLKSFFQIKQAGHPNVYKIVFCPNNCIDVGIFIDDAGVRRLALSSKPFLVQFKKATETEDSSKIMSVVSM